MVKETRFLKTFYLKDGNCLLCQQEVLSDRPFDILGGGGGAGAGAGAGGGGASLAIIFFFTDQAT